MSFVSTFDSGQFGANWDSGLQWDVDVGDIGGDVQKYLDLVTSKHNDKPKFMTMLAAAVSGLADVSVVLGQMAGDFDLDTAVGAQLDVVGLWVGIGRMLSIPLPDVWFSWNVVGLGWNEGSWRDPSDPSSEVITLPDDAYRTLLRARIVNNQWDGSIPGAYEVWDAVFAGTGYSIDITDNQDMTMVFTLRGPQPDAITLALLNGGSLGTVPVGISATYGYTP